MKPNIQIEILRGFEKSGFKKKKKVCLTKYIESMEYT